MKRLILMRHAKSSWDDPALDDHARPLNGRGRVSARVVGDWLRAKGYVPDQVLSSDSKRTRETFAGLKIAADTSFLPALYHAGPDEILRVLRAASGDCVLVLAHNPGIGWFAQNLVTEPPPHPRFFDYPTCATLVADLDITTWAEARLGAARPIDFVIPRELTG